MISFSYSFVPAKFGLCLFAMLAWSGGFPCSAQTPPPVPPDFQDLYTALDNSLSSFNTTLNSQWNGVKYPVIFSAQLWDANANSGPQLVNPNSLVAVQAQLQELKAMGVEGVSVEVGFPMLYEPFFSSESQYQQFVAFYQSVAASVRAQGLKLVVLNTTLWSSSHVLAGWPTIDAFYASLSWDQYQQARAQTAAVIAQTMQPDYMSVLAEPDTEASMTGQSAVNTVSGATSMLSQILSAMQGAGISGVQVGAGVGTWLSGFQQYIQSFVALPVNFIDMHVLPVNKSYLPNALTIASMAAAAGKPVAMSQIWLRKVRDSELGTLSPNVIMARDPFSFWAPLDAYYLQTMENMGYYTQMAFMSVCLPPYFWAYLPYDTTQNLPPDQIMNQETQQANTNMLAASFTSTALSYYNAILPAPDTAPPSTPSNLSGASGQPTQVRLNWNASTDNVGVAGYYVFRNGVHVASSAQPSYTDTGLTGATSYSYFVQAFDLAGNVSAPSLTVPVTTWSTTPPSTPTSVVGTAVSCLQINLTWSASTDAIGISSYRVFRGTSANNLTQVATRYSTPTSYTNYPLTPATTYYFGVEAVDPDGNVSPMSTVVAAATPALPTAPLNLGATPVSTTLIALTWKAGPSGLPIAAYYVFRGTSRTNLTKVAATAATAFTDHSLTPGTTYYYAVEEVDQTGNVSPMSAVVSAATLALPSPPVSLGATPLSTTTIALTWSAGPSGMPVAAYYIFRGTSRSNLTQVATRTVTAFTDSGLTPGTTYYYAVEEKDQGGNVSPMSAVVSATTLALPAPPASVTATAISKAEVLVGWTAAHSGMPLAAYRVYRGTSPSSLTEIVGLGPTTLSFANYSVTPGTTYYYGIQSVDSGGHISPMSTLAQATTPN